MFSAGQYRSTEKGYFSSSEKVYKKIFQIVFENNNLSKDVKNSLISKCFTTRLIEKQTIYLNNFNLII